jgi:pimeloyl-ACP methyl ester carboxylesterase
VYFFGYDWRRDNRATAAELERYIAAVKAERGVSRVDIVAHSMGGLVVSAYLALPSSQASLRRVVLVGSPLLGAGEAFRSLSATSAAGTILGSGSSMLLPGAMGELAATEGTSVRELCQGLDLEARCLLASYPSVYELLRPADARRLAEIGLPASAPSPVAAARAMAEAAAYRARVTGRLASLYRGVDLFLVVGDGRRTFEEKDSYVDGDGLVSVESATAGGPFAPRARRFALGHVELVQDKAALEYIAGIGVR